MSGSKPPLICWDSCIFLAWFKQEQDKPLGEIEKTLRSIAAQKTTLLVSAISFAEVLDKADGTDAGTQFRGFVKRPNVVVADTDMRIGSVAGEIRQKSLAAREEGVLKEGVKIPDALIAATAVQYRAVELHTFDPILLQIGTLGWPVFSRMSILKPDDAARTPLGF